VWRQPRLDRSVEAALASGPAAASTAVRWRWPHATRQRDRGGQERERAQWRILFFRQVADERERRHDSEWGRRVRPHERQYGIII
jgi:hypothetical protein